MSGTSRTLAELAELLYPSMSHTTHQQGLMFADYSQPQDEFKTLLPSASEQVISWAFVVRRFSCFQKNLALTPNQLSDAVKKFEGVAETLNSAYRGSSSKTENVFPIGSWAKDTHIRPPRDLDMYYVLPIEVYQRFEAYAPSVNKQSALLQDVKAKLLDAYPKSCIKGDGPVVLADFYGWTVEVVPAFVYDANERSYYICDTKNGGSYIKAMPIHEVEAINDAERRLNNNVRPLIRMLKCWQNACSVPIRSFYLELLAIDFLDSWEHKGCGLYYYDWMCRDFFQWMISKSDTHIWTPGTYKLMWLGNEWKPKAQAAYVRAMNASELEKENRMIDAGMEWQKIFGIDIPRTV